LKLAKRTLKAQSQIGDRHLRVTNCRRVKQHLVAISNRFGGPYSYALRAPWPHGSGHVAGLRPPDLFASPFVFTFHFALYCSPRSTYMSGKSYPFESNLDFKFTGVIFEVPSKKCFKPEPVRTEHHGELRVQDAVKVQQRRRYALN
jgi:hypothetical protein